MVKRQRIPLVVAALAVLVIGALAAGVSASNLVLAAVVLACPIMMLFMHGSQSGHSGAPVQGQRAGHPGHDHGTSLQPASEVVDAAVIGKGDQEFPRR